MSPRSKKSRSRSRSTGSAGSADAVAADPHPGMDSVLAELPGPDEGDIGEWCSLELARKQAAGRAAQEHELRERFGEALQSYRAGLGQASEYLVVDAVRSGTLAMPLPAPPSPPLTDKEWVRAANYVFETLVSYQFDPADIMDAMVQTRGLGGVTDVLARLCITLPADKLPPGMCDKLEPAAHRVTAIVQPVSAPYDSGCEDGPATPEPESESEPEPNPEPEASALASPSVDGECTTAGSGSGTVAEDDLLTQLVDKLSLEDFGLDCAYDSDEDPGTVCGRRQVRLQALEETVDYARHHGRSDVSDAATALIAQERQSIEALEDDYIYAADQAQAEYERLWPAYYDALLEELRRIREYAAAEAAAAAMYAEAVEIPQVADPAGLLDASDDECGLDRMFDCNDDDDAATIIAPTGPVRRILSTVPPHGWTGAPMREMVDQLVHHYDKQATIRYRLTKSHPGTVCTFVVEWSTPAKAAQILATQRPLAAGSPAAFAVHLLEHSWTLPADLAGHSPRDAKDLGALVFLYMQPEISHQLSSRLPPALHALWDEWGEAEKSSCCAFKMQHRSERIAFLCDLHSQYQQALADAANGDADSGLRPEPGEGRRRRQQQQQQQQGAACQLRKRLWKRTTIGDRQRSAQWQAKYAALQAQLPVRQYRREVVAAMVASRVVIVRGATGSGKSSQVPQFILQLLLASRYTGGRILCTQPRRISATSIATRVSQELGDVAIGDRSLVGYQIRHNAHCSDANALIFCTTGVLLRRLVSDPMLTDIKCIICDEVQERTLELDYLLIVLRRLLARRRDLRLVLMSATIDMDMFASYFDGCAMVDIPGRTFPVRTMFLDHLVQLSEYTLPRHSQYTVRSRTDTDDPLPSDQLGGFNRSRVAVDPDYVSPLAASIVARMRTDIVNLDLIQRLVRGICQARSELPWALFCREPVPQGSVLVFLPGIYEIRRLAQMLQSDPDITVVASVIPLHSSFANERPFNSTMTFAELAFAPPTAGLQRKVVLSTNVAETGITIPDVTIVIDCGLANQSHWDAKCRVQRLETCAISKANVLQRRGRAGRVQPGLALCLFSEEHYRRMSDYERPEIHRLPLTNTCLLAKAHGTSDISRFMQLAVDPPQQSAVTRAIAELQRAGALDEDEELTPIGRHLCHLPVDLSVGKLLIVGTLLGCLDPVLTIAASLSLTTPLLPASGEQLPVHDKYRRHASRAMRELGTDVHESDFMTAVAVHNDWRCIAMRSDVGRRELDMFCYQNQLNRDALEQLEDLREQYLRLIHDLGLVQYPRPAGSGRMSFARLIRPPNRPGSGFPEGFACPPPAANEHGASLGILHAAIAATMDHVIVPSATSQGDYLIGRANVSRRVEGIGHALMLIERERIAARPVDLDRGSVVHRALAHRPQYITRALVAAALSSTTTAASVKATTFATASLAMLVVFARIVEYWPKAQLLIVNRWIHCRCYAKTAVVLLAIRDKYQALLNASIARPADKLPADLAVWRSVILGVFANDCI